MKRCPACDKTFGDSMRFCQIDGTPLVGEDGEATMVQGRPEDLLDVPSAPVNTSQDREQPLMDIPGFDPEPVKPADYSSPPPPSPFSPPPPAESSYQQAKEEEIRSTFGQEPSPSWASAPPPPSPAPPAAPVGQWQPSGAVPAEPFSSAQIGGREQTMAIISLVLGILGLTVCCGAVIPSLAAIITGVIARGKAKKDPSQFGGEGLAMGGIITGIIGLLGGIIVLIFWFLGMLGSVATGLAN